MKILGISNTKDSGACLLINGKLVAAVNEERLNRQKLTREFPTKSISWIFQEFGLSSTDIDGIGLGIWQGVESWTAFPDYLREATQRVIEDPSVREIIVGRVQRSIQSDCQQAEALQRGLVEAGLCRIPVYRCHHHFAHELTAFEFSPFEEALVIVLDGRGDFMSGTVSLWKRGEKPRLIRHELELDSLGAFYGWITQYLGFVPDRHEGKVTGLAARGSAKKCSHIIKKMISYENGVIRGHIGKFYAPFMRADLPQLRKQLSKFGREDIAAAAQGVLEEIVLSYVSHYLSLSKMTRVCLAGGIFANVLLNQKIREIPSLEGCFIYPHMGDGGMAVGGAAHAAKIFGENIQPIKDVYLGPSFSKNECLKAIKSLNLPYEESHTLAKDVAKLIHEGQVVGLFQGKMEYGPRALGNRSIIARTTDSKINEFLNKRLSRSEFMPFAPVTMLEFAQDRYLDWKKEDTSTAYMTSCYACSKKMIKESPAVVHIDGTARPQVISRENNPFYYDILKAYHKISGIPTLINTSFNEHEAPIVCEPSQALSVLARNGIDCLVMPPFLIKKQTAD